MSHKIPVPILEVSCFCYFCGMDEAKTRKHFFNVGHLEGVSYLVLLFIAMPLKYIWKIDKAVYWTGMAHGVLFIAYLILLALLFFRWKTPFKKCFAAGLLSLVPLGTFFLKKVI